MNSNITDMYKHKREKTLAKMGYTEGELDEILAENEATENIDAAAMLESVMTRGERGDYDTKMAKRLLSRKMNAMENTFALMQAEFEAGSFDEFLRDDENSEN